MSLLALQGVTAGYEGIPVVHEIDLTVEAGEVVALLGANGAGKTTTLLTVSGLLPVIDGTIEVLHWRQADALGAIERRTRSAMPEAA